MTNLSFSDITSMIADAESNLSSARYKQEEEKISYWNAVLEKLQAEKNNLWDLFTKENTQ